jgi:hypothetical protein
MAIKQDEIRPIRGVPRPRTVGSDGSGGAGRDTSGSAPRRRERHCVEWHCPEQHCVEWHCPEQHCVEWHCPEQHCVEWHCLEQHCLEQHCLEQHCLEQDRGQGRDQGGA